MITIPLFKVIKNDNFCLYLPKNLHFMETDNISNLGYGLGSILAVAAIASIIAFIASSINEKYTFKNTFAQAFLFSSIVSLSINLYKAYLYSNLPYDYYYPSENLYNRIGANILCFIVSLILIYNSPKKDKFARFSRIDQAIINDLNHFEHTTQKLIQQKEDLKNALQSELISQSEYEEKVAQIDARIENERQITDRIKKRQAKVEKLKSFFTKKIDLYKLYANSVLTPKEYRAKLEELEKEELKCISETNDEFEFIKKMIEEYHKKI